MPTGSKAFSAIELRSFHLPGTFRCGPHPFSGLKKSISPINCQEMLLEELEVVSKPQIMFESPVN